MLVTVVVATVGIVVSLPLGILLALGRRSRCRWSGCSRSIFIEFVRGVPLITVLFMASVMLPLFVPERFAPDKLVRALIGVALFASAYMAEVVRGGLQAMPSGQYEAAQALGLALLADDGAHHPAAGAARHVPEHRQQLHRPVQGHDAGVRRRHFRFPAHHRSGTRRSQMGEADDPPPAMPLPRCSISYSALACRAMRAGGSAAGARAAGVEAMRWTNRADQCRRQCTAPDVAVEIIGLHKWYGEFHVLRDINLKVARGERIVICGPSGAGKSTLLRCINRLEDWQRAASSSTASN